MKKNNLNKQEHQKATISGFRWNILDQIISQGTTFAVGIILMNLLPPSEFGLIAMATVFTGFLGLFSKFGLSASLVQSLEITKIDIDTVFWASVIVGGVLAMIMFLSSRPIAILYGQPELTLIIKVLAGIFILLPLESIPTSLLQREMLFDKLFLVSATSVVLASALTIYLAYTGMGVWALVFHRISESSFKIIGLTIIVRFRPLWQFSFKHLKKHMRFGLPYLGSKSLIYWIGNADNLIIGYFMDPKSLGFYSRAYSIVTIPANRIGITIFKVLFPALSKVQEDPKRMRGMFDKVNSILMFIITPTMVYIALVAEPFILLIVGEEWLPSAVLLKFLALVAISKVNMLLLHNLLISQGRADLDFKLNAYLSPFLILTFLIGALTDLQTLVILYSITSFLILLVWYFVVARFLEKSFFSFSKIIINMSFNIVVIYFSWTWIENMLGDLSNILTMIYCFFYVSIIWVSLQMILRKSETLQHLNLFKQFINYK